MELTDIKRIANPYSSITHSMKTKDFVGREEIISKLRIILDDSLNTGSLKNIYLSGEKSCGKSSLLHRFKNILLENNYFVYEEEFSRDESDSIDEFEFFKDFIDFVFRDDSILEASSINNEQREIWFSLTGYRYDHKSEYTQRQLQFATLYASKMLGRPEKLNYKRIENDLRLIFDDILDINNGYTGIAFLLDEFQELNRNPTLLDILRKVTEYFPKVIIISAGLPTLFENSLFEKYLRTSETIAVTNFKQDESLKLIFQPLENALSMTRIECSRLIGRETVDVLLDRTGGNPLHLRILLSKLFDDFISDPTAEQMTLSRRVMEEVMHYYCNQSEKSRIIKNSLETASRDQLIIFARLLKFNGLTIKSIILLQMAFESIQSEQEEKIKEKIVTDLEEIYDLGLFRIEGANCEVSELHNLNANKLSQIRFFFNGDLIDKLYASYYYEDLTNEVLISNEDRSFEDLLALELSNELSKSLSAKKVSYSSEYPAFSRIFNDNSIKIDDCSPLIKAIDRINKYDPEKQISDSVKQDFSELSKKYDLLFPAHILNQYEFEGYYMLITGAKVRGKDRAIYNFFPIKGAIDKIINYREQITDYNQIVIASLEEYSISIQWMYLYFLPKHSMILIHYNSLEEEAKLLEAAVEKRNFSEALKLAHSIFRLNIRIKGNKIGTTLQDYNNLGFCLINVGEYSEAEKIFGTIKDKYFLSKLNLAFICFATNRLDAGWSYLNTIKRKKIPQNEEIGVLHLFIKHDKLKYDNILIHKTPLRDTVLMNLALLSAYSGKDKSIANGMFNDVNSTLKKNALGIRVRTWINYYSNERENCIADLQNALNRCDSSSYLYEDIKFDIEYFRGLDLPDTQKKK